MSGASGIEGVDGFISVCDHSPRLVSSGTRLCHRYTGIISSFPTTAQQQTLISWQTDGILSGPISSWNYEDDKPVPHINSDKTDLYHSHEYFLPFSLPFSLPFPSPLPFSHPLHSLTPFPSLSSLSPLSSPSPFSLPSSLPLPSLSPFSPSFLGKTDLCHNHV